jgi:hypothetical protein
LLKCEHEEIKHVRDHEMRDEVEAEAETEAEIQQKTCTENIPTTSRLPKCELETSKRDQDQQT